MVSYSIKFHTQIVPPPPLRCTKSTIPRTMYTTYESSFYYFSRSTFHVSQSHTFFQGPHFTPKTSVCVCVCVCVRNCKPVQSDEELKVRTCKMTRTVIGGAYQNKYDWNYYKLLLKLYRIYHEIWRAHQMARWGRMWWTLCSLNNSELCGPKYYQNIGWEWLDANNKPVNYSSR